jgi:hypothetical protein
MLVGMDIPAAAAGPWIALGLVLAVLLLGLAGLAAALLFRRTGSDATAARPPDGLDDGSDDLARFLEHPPGSPGDAGPPGSGWAVLSHPQPPEPALPTPTRSGARRAVLAMAVAAVLLLGAAAVLATGLRRPDAGPSHVERTAGGRPVEMRLSFGGVVLEQHAVGVTATYPELRVTGDRSRARAHVELPTYNCLADEAPADPVAAGCRRSTPEYADLAAPDLQLRDTGGRLKITGRFSTVTRPNGSAPAATGRSYQLRVTVVPGDRPQEGWLPAEGVLSLGPDEAATTGTDADAGINVLRYGDR